MEMQAAPKPKISKKGLEEVSEVIFDQMQKSGWWRYSDVRRFDRPIAGDINNGNCEDWADEAQKRFGGDAIWIEQYKTCEDWAHCVLKLNGKYYDSFHLEGSSNLKDFIKVSKIEFAKYKEIIDKEDEILR